MNRAKYTQREIKKDNIIVEEKNKYRQVEREVYLERCKNILKQSRNNSRGTGRKRKNDTDRKREYWRKGKQ